MVSARNKVRLLTAVGALSLALGLSVTACNLVLGIGQATWDPSLDDAGVDAGTAGDAGDGGITNDCNTYCTLIEDNCPHESANGEYISRDVCMAMCATFDPGKLGDTSIDSLGCRITYAQKAAGDPLTYCQKAGPLAGGGCADPCSSFCLLADALCTPAKVFPYDGGVPECRASCASYTYLLSADAGDASVGDILFLSGDTLNCRLYHLESAYDSTTPNAVNFHCPHTAAQSATCN